MSAFSGTDIIERLDEIITVLEQNENQFYVEIDLAHQLRDQLAQTIDLSNTSNE
jgi:hypothetical protein